MAEISPKNLNDALLNSFNEIKSSKSIQSLEKLFSILKEAIPNIFEESQIPNKTSKDIIFFLSNNLIDSKLQSDIFKLYIDSFFSLKDKLKTVNKTENYMLLEKILDPNSLIYEKAKETKDTNLLIEAYFNKYFPKEEMKYEPGKKVDVLISELYLDKVKMYSWVQLPIKKFENNTLYFHNNKFDKEEDIEIKELHFIREQNTFVKEEEMLWRKTLKIGDKVDTLDNKLNWIPAKILNIINNNVVLLPFGYKKEDIIIKDNISPLIRPYGTFSLKYEQNDEQYLPLIKKNSAFTPFSFCLPAPKYEEGKNINYLIPDGKTFSLLYFDIFNYFLNLLMNSKILEGKSDDYSFEFIVMISIFISKGYLFTHHDFINYLYNEKLYPLLKEALLKASLDKKKNLESKNISKLFEIIFYGLEHKYYEFDQIKIILELTLNFGLNCFNESEIFQKRLIGLNNIILGLNTYRNYFNRGGRKEEYNEKIHNYLLNEKDKNKNILELIFNNKFSIHEQLILKGKEILNLLFKLYIFKDNDSNNLIDIFISSMEGTDAYKQLYLILEEIINNFSSKQLIDIIYKITKISMKQIKKKDINILFKTITSFKNPLENKKEITTALDYIFNYILEDINNSQELSREFIRTIDSLKPNDFIVDLWDEYNKKIFNELLKKNEMKEISLLFKFIKNFIRFFYNDDVKEKIGIKFLEFLDKNNNIKKILDKVFENNNEGNYSYLMNIFEVLTEIISFIKNNIFLDTDTIIKFFDILLKNPEGSEHHIFNNSMATLRENKLIDIKNFSEKYFLKLDELLSDMTDKTIYLYFNLFNNGLFYLTISLYNDINNIDDSDNNHEENKYISEKCFIKKNPMENKYFNVLFKLFTKFYDKKMINNFLNAFSLRLFCPEERYHIWKNMFKKIFEHNYYNNQTLMCMINTIIEKSEKYGTASVISHSTEKITKLPIKLKISLERFNLYNLGLPDEIEIKNDLFTTNTIYDLKKEISKQIKIDPLFLDISNTIGKCSMKNNETLYFLINLENYENYGNKVNYNKVHTIQIRFSPDLFKMKKYNLIDQKNPGEFNTKANNIFSNIYKNITNFTEKLTYDLYVKFQNGFFSSESEEVMKTSFNSLDEGNKGYLSFQEFLKVLWHKKEKHIYQIYQMINYFGFRNDFELIYQPLNESSPAYYIENNKTEFMPRYFIGKNPEYMNKIFEIGTQSDIIKEECDILINKLSSMIDWKDLFLDENLNKKIDEIIENKNIEMKTYIFDIILSELKKNNENKNKDMDNVIDLFIEKNIERLIDNLDDCTKIIKEQKVLFYLKYYNYFNTIIQIILFSLMRLINKPNFSQIILDISNEPEKRKEEKLLSVISELIINSKQKEILEKINYQKLMNIIITFLISITKETITIEEDSQNILNILLLLFILFENNINNNEKDIIYINYINNIANICLIPIYECLNLIEEYNSYIFYIKKTDKNFISLIMAKISKEIINYEKYNNIASPDSKIYIFKIFELIIKILITNEENENKENNIYNDNNENYLVDILKNIINIIINNEIHLNEELITNYLKLLHLIISKVNSLNNKTLNEIDFSSVFTILINNFLIISPISENKNELYSNNNSQDYIDYLFDLINIIIEINPQKYLLEFFSQEKIKNLISIYLSQLPLDTRNYSPKEESLSNNNYLGIKNISSICYMNSVLQTLYMVPLFRQSILSLKINSDTYKKNESKEDFDDFLFQLIRLFNYLTFSNKSYYNPKHFVFSFKDSQGNPTNPSVQCDAEEFLTKFMDKLEKALNNTPYKFLCHNILGGKTLQQIICSNPECNNISRKTDNIVYLSLDIRDNKSLKECLDKYIIKEKIEDYHCEKCDQKTVHTKQVLIQNLPNILIIHLQRITFNYETFNMVKIKDKVSFETNLNIKDYTFDPKDDDKKYEYELTGIIVHVGIAQAGHYYTFIKSQDKKNKNVWFKFNDMTVTQTTFDNIMKDLDYNTYNNYIPSPYMLIYEKKVKNPIFINVEEIHDINVINSLEKENINDIAVNEVKSEVYKDENEALEKNKDVDKINKYSF